MTDTAKERNAASLTARVRRKAGGARRRLHQWSRARRLTRIAVRQVTQDDVDAMLAFWEVAPPKCVPDMTAVRLGRVMDRAPQLVLVVEEDGAIVGTAVGTHDYFRAYAYGVAVHPRHRRHAIGSALIAELERRLLATGYHRLFALVRRDDVGAQAFCRALGYTEFQPPALYEVSWPRTERTPVFGVDVRHAEPRDLDDIVRLWNEAGLVHRPERSRDEAIALMNALPELFTVAEIDGEVVGTTSSGYDCMQTWGYRQAVSPRHRRRGVASAMANFRAPFREAIDEEWRGGTVLASNEDAAGYAASRGNSEYWPEWAYMRRVFGPAPT